MTISRPGQPVDPVRPAATSTTFRGFRVTPDHSQHESIEQLQQQIAELREDCDRWRARYERSERKLQQEQEHVKALLSSLTRAEQANPPPVASRSNVDESEEETAGTLAEYFDPEADALDQLLGRDKTGNSHPHSISSTIDRLKHWLKQP